LKSLTKLEKKNAINSRKFWSQFGLKKETRIWIQIQRRIFEFDSNSKSLDKFKYENITFFPVLGEHISIRFDSTCFQPEVSRISYFGNELFRVGLG